MRKAIPCSLLIAAFSFSVAAQKAPVKTKTTTMPKANVASTKTSTRFPTLKKLTAEEVAAIIRSEGKNNPFALQTLDQDREQRVKVLENLRQALAVASEAVNTGFADDQKIKTQLDLHRVEILASAYNDKLKADGGKQVAQESLLGYIDPKLVEAFFALPANKTKYAKDRENMLAIFSDLPKNLDEKQVAEQKAFLMGQWEATMYGAAKAMEAKLDTADVQLQYRTQQALSLTRMYGQAKLQEKLKATDHEIDALMARDPRFDTAQIRRKATEIKAKAKAGEDFAALANTYSEDPGNRGANGMLNGGLYDWRDRAVYVTEFSDASWALNEGQVSDVVETQFGFHVLKLEGKRVQKGTEGKDEQQVKVRHILVSTEYVEPVDPNSDANAKAAALDNSPISMREGAQKEIEKKKQKLVLDDIVKRNPIELPADFQLAASAANASAPAKLDEKPVVKKKPARRASTVRKPR